MLLLSHQIILYVWETIFQKGITTIDEKIKDEKLQYNINRETAKWSVLSWYKIDKYRFLTGVEEILPSDQSQIEQMGTIEK